MKSNKKYRTYRWINGELYAGIGYSFLMKVKDENLRVDERRDEVAKLELGEMKER